MEYSDITIRLAERFRQADDTLTSLPVKTTPRPQLEAARRDHDDAAQALAHAALSDIDRGRRNGDAR